MINPIKSSGESLLINDNKLKLNKDVNPTRLALFDNV